MVRNNKGEHMKASKIVLAVVIIAIAGYIASKYFGARASAVDKKAQWYIKLDKNGDGSLSIEELKIIDANGDGVVTSEEAAMYQIPAEVLKEWDTNGDGSISLKELNACGC
jgi:Kef-type K+ transport system membrane component KefB